ncbi:MAG: hypothetical protein AAGA48_22295 [Myxococcota bacterium]
MIPLVAAFPFLGFIGKDPAPSVFRSSKAARELECQRVSGEVGRSRTPNEIKPDRPRGSYAERDVLYCRQRILREGVRHPRDEAVLRGLEEHANEVASLVASIRADLSDRTWLVESFYPSPAVGTKIAFATKSALMRQTLKVSDRVPLLSATDIDIFMRMPPDQAYPAACERWQSTGQLRDTDVLLAQVIRDLRETRLHTGLCFDGQWMWLR